MALSAPVLSQVPASTGCGASVVPPALRICRERGYLQPDRWRAPPFWGFTSCCSAVRLVSEVCSACLAEWSATSDNVLHSSAWEVSPSPSPMPNPSWCPVAVDEPGVAHLFGQAGALFGRRPAEASVVAEPAPRVALAWWRVLPFRKVRQSIADPRPAALVCNPDPAVMRRSVEVSGVWSLESSGPKPLCAS